jgi:hypothetical protein
MSVPGLFVKQERKKNKKGINDKEGKVEKVKSNNINYARIVFQNGHTQLTETTFFI